MVFRKTGLHATAAALLMAVAMPTVALALSFHANPEQPVLPPEFSPLVMGGAGYKEEYLARVLAQFRMHAGEDQIIDRTDSELRELMQAAQRRASTLSRFIALDLDQDGKVIPDEIAIVYSGNNANQSSLIARMDADRDGSITQAEWEAGSAVPSLGQVGSRGDNVLRTYLALDPNGDDALTADELRAIATALFDRYDADGDGNLSRDEARTWSSGAAAAMQAQRRAAVTPEIQKTWTNQASGTTSRLPPVLVPVAGPPSVTLLTEHGASSDAGFSVKGNAGAALGKERSFVVTMSGGTPDLKPSLSFETGSNFKITAENCGQLLTTKRSCEVKVAMTAAYNGIFKDKLLINAGKAAASLEITGEASGWPDADLIWDGQNAQLMSSGAVPPSNMLRITGSRSEFKTFRLTNRGAGHAPPPELAVSDITGQAKEGWSVSIDEKCATDGIAPGGSCEVSVQPKPKFDGQANGVITAPGGNRGEPSKTLILGAIIKGVGGQLPPDVIGNGDRCPAPGSAAEVAVSSTEGFRANDGYFNAARHGYGDAGFEVVTAGCTNWQPDYEGKLSCQEKRNEGHHSSTMRRYEGKAIEGPWTPTELKPGYISARLDCKDGLIETIEWTW